MGVFFGNVYYAAIHPENLQRSGVYMTSKMPDGSGDWFEGMEVTSDRYCFNQADPKFIFTRCKSEAEAIKTVKVEILTRTQYEVIETSSVLASTQCELELSKYLKDKVMVEVYTADLLEMNNKLKALKTLRRAKVKELFESDIKPVSKKKHAHI